MSVIVFKFYTVLYFGLSDSPIQTYVQLIAFVGQNSYLKHPLDNTGIVESIYGNYLLILLVNIPICKYSQLGMWIYIIRDTIEVFTRLADSRKLDTLIFQLW